jgi:predicted oxidoreductase
MEVISEQGKGIPGLYAAGHEFGFDVNSGCTSGERAVRYIKLNEK